MERYEISFDYTPDISRQCMAKILWRLHCPYIISSIIIFILCLRALSDPYYRPLASFGLGIVVVFWYVWVEHYVRAGRSPGLSPGRKSDTSVRVVLEDEVFRFETAEAKYMVQWKAFARLYKLKRFLILHLGYIYFPIPTDTASAEAIAFLENKVREAKGIQS